MGENGELRAKAREVAAWLEGWAISNGDGPRDNTVYLVGPVNVQVLVSRPWNQKGRIEFSVSPDPGLHEFRPYNDDSPSAGVSADREPQSIAKDIKRRCLDPAVPYVLALREKKAAKDRIDAARFALLERMAQACGGRVVGRYNHPAEKPMESSVRRGEYSNPMVKAELTYGKMLDLDTHTYGPDRVKMEIDYLSQEDAIALLSWLRLRLWPENGEQGQLF